MKRAEKPEAQLTNHTGSRLSPAPGLLGERRGVETATPLEAGRAVDGREADVGAGAESRQLALLPHLHKPLEQARAVPLVVVHEYRAVGHEEGGRAQSAREAPATVDEELPVAVMVVIDAVVGMAVVEVVVIDAVVGASRVVIVVDVGIVDVLHGVVALHSATAMV